MGKQTKLHPNIGGIIFMNPGSGPVEHSSLENAISNMEVFCKDLENIDGNKWIWGTDEREDFPDDGRFPFIVWRKDSPEKQVDIDMPGIPVDEVRYVDSDTQNIWDFPRLYVDGSSWVWKFALNSVIGEEEEEKNGK